MLLLHLFLSCVSLAPAPATAPFSHVPPATEAQRGDEKAVKALETWLKNYRAGKIEFASRRPIDKDSVAAKFGLLPKDATTPLTAEDELTTILSAVAALESTDAVEALLSAAAVGYEQPRVKYTVAMAPNAVRVLGERYAARIQAAAAIDHVRKVASGEFKIEKASLSIGMRAAALRALGSRKDLGALKLSEAQLQAADGTLRLAAAQALALVADESSCAALTSALSTESSPEVVPALVAALRACLGKHLPSAGAVAAESGGAKPPTKSDVAVRAGDAAGAAIGRADWRADMELVALVGDLGTTSATPALIGVLQRFHDHPELVKSGALSTLLLYRTHETLVTLTGAVYPAEQPAQWQDFWTREQQKLLAADRVVPAKKEGGADKTAAFCGIPAQGSRILFVIDLSGSMEFKMKAAPGETDAGSGGGTRLAFAKRQMHKVIAEMPEGTRMNFITFNGRPKARLWNKDMLEASPKNKKKALEFVESWTAVYPPPNQTDGGTNMWSGLEEALTVKSLVHGEKDERGVDEIFVVSDGAPSVGEILDPLEILRLVDEANRIARIRINTIFITSADDRDPRQLTLSPSELMRRMAAENGGRFVEFKN